MELVAVNDPFGDSHTMAFLLKHDSVGGVLPNEVAETGIGFSIDGREIKKLEEREPADIPWGDNGVDVVIESTGLFTAREKAAAHLKGGAKRVVISAPSGDADVMICMGVNDEVYDADAHTVISNASCTTNCLAPMAKVLQDSFGIDNGLITTVHAYTSDQQLQDMAVASRSGKPDLRRMPRGRAVDHPEHHGRGPRDRSRAPRAQGPPGRDVAARPTPTGSITDLVANLSREASVDEVNAAFKASSESPKTRGVLEYNDEPLVSADIVGNPSSCIYSAMDTMANGKMVKVLGWYDNEWGYSNRLIDLVGFIGDR